MEQENIGQDQTGSHSYISATTAHLLEQSWSLHGEVRSEQFSRLLLRNAHWT